MKRIAFVGSVGAGKTTLFNALQGDYTLARKTQAVEFNDNGDIDTPGEYFSHPRWYHALITTLQDVLCTGHTCQFFIQAEVVLDTFRNGLQLFVS